MFEWSGKLYMDDKVRKNPAKYKKLAESGKLLRHCYLITLPMNEKNCMDIYSTREFWFQYYQKRTLKVIGIASSRDSAEELICEMVRDIYAVYRDIGKKEVSDYFSGVTKTTA